MHRKGHTMKGKQPSVLHQLAAYAAAAGLQSMARAAAAKEDTLVQLGAISGAETTPMIEQLSELAKLGYGPDQLKQLVHAAEHSQIIAFEHGKIRHIGAARTLREILQEETP